MFSFVVNISVLQKQHQWLQCYVDTLVPNLRRALHLFLYMVALACQAATAACQIISPVLITSLKLEGVDQKATLG